MDYAFALLTHLSQVSIVDNDQVYHQHMMILFREIAHHVVRLKIQLNWAFGWKKFKKNFPLTIAWERKSE